MTLAEEGDVKHSLQHINDHCKKDGNNPFFHVYAGERTRSELQQEEFKLDIQVIWVRLETH